MAGAIAGTAPEGRNRLMIAAAVLFAAIAAVLLFVALQNRDESVGGSAAVTTEVVVAGQNIETNTKLTADMLELAPFSSDQVLSGAYSSIDRAIDLPVRFPLQKGEQVTRSKIGADAIEDEKDLALVLDPGMRGFSVSASEVTGVGGLLLPGNFVDVIAVFPDGPAGLSRIGELQDIEDIKAVTLLQNVEILGVAQEAQEPVPAAPASEDSEAEVGVGIRGERPDDVERQPSARTVTLAVTQADAQLLGLVQEIQGIIWLSLRPVGETGDPLPAEINVLPLLESPIRR